MKRSKATLLGLLLPMGLLLVSCSKREDLPLAEFKDRTITVADFERAYSKVDPVFLPKAAGFEGKKEFLTTMLNRAVMEEKADELGYDKDPSVVQGMEAFNKMGLQAVYIKRQVLDKIDVSEEEMREHYNNLGAVLSVKQILLDTPAERDEIYQMLLDGADFESVLREYSKGPDAPQGGLVQTIPYGKYAPDFQYAVFRTKVGDFTKPIFTPYGWFIIKVLKRVDEKRKDPYESMKPQLREQVHQLKEIMASNEMTEKVREKYKVEWYYDGLEIAFNALPPDRAFDNAPHREDEVYPLLFFDVDDLDKPLATYKDKTITIKDFSDFYDQASFFTRPRRDFRLGGIRTFLTERIMNEIVGDEMALSNVSQDEEFVKVTKSKRYEMMVNRLYDDMIKSKTVVPEKEIRAYYDNNASSFVVPEKRRFGVILTGSKEDCDAAYAELKDGALFRTVAMAYSIDKNTRSSLGETEQLGKGENPEIDAVGFSLPRVGAYSEPFQTGRGWMILKLTEIVPERTFSFEEARDQVRANLLQIKAEDRLEELLTKWKKEFGVVIHEDNLRKTKIEERSVTNEQESSPEKGKGEKA